MTSAFRARDPVDAPAPHGHAEADLLFTAGSLAAASRAGQPATLLRGRNFGIFCDDSTSPAATLFASAATELGAHVACIPITLTDRSLLTVIRETAALLSRLYDAVECLDMSPRLIESMRESADIPLFSGLSCEGHWTAALAARMTCPPGSESAARRSILQAVLVRTVRS